MILSLNHEMRVAQQMQMQLMPSAITLCNIQQKMGVNITSHFACSSELGGDFWGCKMLSDEELAIYICDFSGHGIASAINTFRFHALLEQQAEQYGRDPSFFLGLLNQQMHCLLQPDQFATAFYGVLHLGLDSLFYVAAGAPRPALRRADGSIEWIDSSGLPVGIRANHTYPLREIPFYAGDALLCYSDCLIEEPTLNGNLLAEENIASLFSQHQNPIEVLLKPFTNTNGQTTAFSDDLTVNVYVRV